MNKLVVVVVDNPLILCKRFKMQLLMGKFYLKYGYYIPLGVKSFSWKFGLVFFIPASFKSIHQSNHERLTEDIKQRSNPYKELRLEKPLYSVPTWVKCRPFLPYSYSSSLRQSMLVSATCARQGSCLIWYGLCLFAWAVENRHQHPHPDCLSRLWCFQGRCCHRCPHSSVSVL